MALSREISRLEIYAPSKDVARQLEKVKEDIAGTMRVRDFKITTSKPELRERIISIEPNFARLGSRLRDDVKIVAEAIQNAKPEEIAEQLAMGKITIKKDKKTIELSLDDLKVVKETESAGYRVDVIDIQEPAITLFVYL